MSTEIVLLKGIRETWKVTLEENGLNTDGGDDGITENIQSDIIFCREGGEAEVMTELLKTFCQTSSLAAKEVETRLHFNQVC